MANLSYHENVDKKKYITFADFFGKGGICSKLYHPRVT